MIWSRYRHILVVNRSTGSSCVNFERKHFSALPYERRVDPAILYLEKSQECNQLSFEAALLSHLGTVEPLAHP